LGLLVVILDLLSRVIADIKVLVLVVDLVVCVQRGLLVLVVVVGLVVPLVIALKVILRRRTVRVVIRRTEVVVRAAPV
jgi:hypothetical protein